MTARRPDSAPEPAPQVPGGGQALPPLRETDDLARAILAHIDEVVYIVRATGDPLGGTVEYVSDRARDITGFEPAAFRSDPGLWSRLLHPEDVQAMRDATLRMLETRQGCTRVYRVRNGQTDDYRWLEDRVLPILDAHGAVTSLVGAARDITDRRRAEEALEARERQQAAVADLGQRALSGVAIETLMSETVALVAETLGVEYAKVLELLPDGRALLLRAGVGWREGLVGRATVGSGRASQAGFTLHSDGPVVVDDLRSETRFEGPPLLRDHGVVSGLSVAIRGEERPFGILGAHTTRRRDFTADDVHFLESIANVLANAALRKRQERLRGQLLERVISAQEEERRRMTRELHDEIGQQLTALKFGLETCDSACPGLHVANDLIARVRDLSMSLRPGILDDLGLVPALLWLFDRYSAEMHLRVDFQQAGVSRRFPREVETAVFRIVQEALTNTARHAGVGAAQVRVWAQAERLGARIEDEGCGFDLTTALAGSTAGLAGMRERAEILGGVLTIESEPGSGARLSVELPLAPETDP